jgi:hypothetical protein
MEQSLEQTSKNGKWLAVQFSYRTEDGQMREQEILEFESFSEASTMLGTLHRDGRGLYSHDRWHVGSRKTLLANGFELQ